MADGTVGGKALQRRRPDGLLKIVARGVKEDGLL